ncbi:hypothetical protein DPMN_003686 [Dreissena polymorpha]|uniref:Uncharacterized protein n=1 Tax=Dreissena polymorpha TaxID=45954 RepID=A0A9D4RUZ1_DREPO|nr:hypothetical protein DPMN_003686 [Dreissena polymorpha]
MYGLLDQVFTLHELANSRGTGVGKPRPGDEHKPVLDQGKLDILRDFVIGWGRKNAGGVTFPLADLNNAVMERNSYARKQLKKRVE